MLHKLFFLFSLVFLINCFQPNDVTIVLATKEQHFIYDLFEEFMNNVPQNVRVICFPNVPMIHPEDEKKLQHLQFDNSNLEVIYDTPYQNYYVSRRKAFLEYNIDTKFVLFSDFQVLLTPDFIESIIDFFKARQEYELSTTNKISTRIMLPKLKENGFEKTTQHPELTPLQKIKSSKGWHYFGALEKLKNRIPKTNPELPKFSPDIGKLVEYVEDHLFIVDSEFFRKHLSVFTLEEASLHNDQFYHSLITLAEGGTILQYPYEIEFYFFKYSNIDNLHFSASKRSECMVNLGYRVISKIFNHFERKPPWMNFNVKDKFFSKISVNNILDLDYYSINHPQANLRHTNLFIGSLLFASLCKFEIKNNEDIIKSNLNPIEILQEVFYLYSNNTDCNNNIYIKGERICESRINSLDLPNYSDKLDFIPIAPGNVKKLAIDRLQGDCLYHSGNTNEQLNSVEIQYYIKISIINQEGMYYDYFMWHRGQIDHVCKDKITVSDKTWTLVDGVNLPIYSHNQQVYMNEFHFRFTRI